MKTDRFEDIPPAVPRAGWAVLVLLAGLATYAAFDTWRTGDALRGRALDVAARLSPDPEAGGEDEKNAPEAPPALKRLAARHFFVAKSEPRFRDIRGVLGDRVLYPGGKSYAVGDKVMGATVKEVGLNMVKLEYKGETIEIPLGGGRSR